MRHRVSGSSYSGVRDGLLVRLTDGSSAPALDQFVHDQFRSLVTARAFTCLGARAAINKKTYRFAMYDELGCPASAVELAHDLTRFIAEVPFLGEITTFIACFREPIPLDEREFEALLWMQLQVLHDVDQWPWDPHASTDPEDSRFAFSFSGRAFYIVGLHAGSSRWSRRFAWPTLVFNLMSQFDHLRATCYRQRCLIMDRQD